jgi:hypothetical protein
MCNLYYADARIMPTILSRSDVTGGQGVGRVGIIGCAGGNGDQWGACCGEQGKHPASGAGAGSHM